MLSSTGQLTQEQIMQNADQIGCTYGFAAMDALHVAAALQIKADQLIIT
ncbi:type II toxin-antitoxin system VapC family toxin [Nostoc sp. 'Peltigera malacea cyanobiont' DB3992]|nr:type II toxin-antitoxin system VapC family toxin [Nostoc sp. 'Peltigera malacea cyanobiont' DB3992]